MPDGSVPAGRGLAGWLSGIAPARARGEVTVAIVSDRRMRVLNRTFRG
jgi:ssRNA-specific RNase YbeY (16S rRNA maturation enzyme)